MKHLLSKSKTFAVLALSLFTSIGVFSGISATNKQAEPVSAASSNAYLELGGDWTYQAYYTIHYWGESSSSTWPGANFNNNQQASNAGTVISASWESNSTHCIICRWGNSSHSGEGQPWGRWDYFDSHSFTAGEYNYFRVTSGSSIESSFRYVVTSSVKNSTGGTITMSNESSTKYNDKVYTINSTTAGVNLTATPSSGYRFVGWELNGATVSSSTSYSPRSINSDREYKAIFELIPADKYNVSYYPNGGSGTTKTFQTNVGSSTTIKNYSDFDISFTAPSGKKFKEWNTNASGTGTPYAPGSSIPSQTKDSTFPLYAIWKDKVADGWYLRGGSWGWNEDGQKQMVNDTSTTNQVMVKGINLENGQAVKPIKYVSDTGDYWNPQATSMDGSAYSLSIDTSPTSSYGNVILGGSGARGVFNIYWHYADDYKMSFYALRIQYNPNNGTSDTISSDYPVSEGYKATVTTSEFTWSQHTFTGWNTKQDGSGDSYKAGDKIDFSNLEDSVTLYAQWSQTDVTFTYSKVLNGVDTEFHSDGTTPWWGTVSKTVDFGVKYSTVTPDNVYGFGFDGWFSDKACTVGIGANQVTSSKVYAKYSSLSNSKIVYVALDETGVEPGGSGYSGKNPYRDVTYSGALKLWINGTGGETKDVPVQKVEGIASTNLYMASIPEDVTWFAFHSGLDNTQMQYGHRTYGLNLTDAGNHNLYIVNDDADTTKDDGTLEYGGYWSDCYFQFQTSNTSTFSSITKVQMRDPVSMSSKNDAEALDVTANQNDYFRVAVVIDGHENYLTSFDNMHQPTKDVTILDGSGNPTNQFSKNTTVNVYLKENHIYLVDQTTISYGGRLYISTDSEPTELLITVKVQTGIDTYATPFADSKLSTVSGIEITTTLKYGGVEGMIVLPIYNLRGNATPIEDSIYEVTLDGKKFNLEVSDETPYYYINLDSYSAPTKDHADALGARAAFDLDKTILGSVNSSVCNCSQTTAIQIREEFEAASESSLLPNAEICTYVGALGSEKQFISITLPYSQIERIADMGENAFKSNLGSYRNTLDSEDQTIMIVVISCASLLMLSAGALTILLKKKKKENID